MKKRWYLVWAYKVMATYWIVNPESEGSIPPMPANLGS